MDFSQFNFVIVESNNIIFKKGIMIKKSQNEKVNFSGMLMKINF